MTKIAFLSDIHGNAIALDGCLKQLQKLQIDAVYFLGDAVGYMPAAREVLTRLVTEGIQCQQGNHERMLLSSKSISCEKEASYRLLHAHGQLDTRHLSTIGSWPSHREITWFGSSVLLVHGSPHSPIDGYVYPNTDLTPYHGLPYDTVIMGHTHYPFIRQSGGKQFVNTGSVGLPRDQGNLSSFVVYDAVSFQFEIIRIQFDLNEVLTAYGNQIADSVRACLQRPGAKGGSD